MAVTETQQINSENNGAHIQIDEVIQSVIYRTALGQELVNRALAIEQAVSTGELKPVHLQTEPYATEQRIMRSQLIVAYHARSLLSDPEQFRQIPIWFADEGRTLAIKLAHFPAFEAAVLRSARFSQDMTALSKADFSQSSHGLENGIGRAQAIVTGAMTFSQLLDLTFVSQLNGNGMALESETKAREQATKDIWALRTRNYAYGLQTDIATSTRTLSKQWFLKAVESKMSEKFLLAQALGEQVSGLETFADVPRYLKQLRTRVLNPEDTSAPVMQLLLDHHLSQLCQVITFDDKNALPLISIQQFLDRPDLQHAARICIADMIGEYNEHFVFLNHNRLH